MSHIVLAVNAGSSSVKVSVFETNQRLPHELASAQVDGLTAPPATLKYTCGETRVKGQELPDVHGTEDALNYILDHLEKDSGLTQLSSRDAVHYVCHRIVHGGDYNKPVRIDDATYKHLEELSELAPLHNQSALALVRAVGAALPRASNIAFFDSAFHATIPEHVRTYPISPRVAKEKRLRKYGFHGLSYAFISGAVASHLSKPAAELNIIALHLGSGASACAILGGRSLDTSMGLTPLAGLPGATRSGSVDPSLVFHYGASEEQVMASQGKLHMTRAEEILNKESGWKALTGTTDFGKISSEAEAGSKDHALAFDMFADRVSGFVGSYYVSLRGKVDALVFAGGIGERGSRLRKAVVEATTCLGFQLDTEKNEHPGDDGSAVVDIGAESSRHRVLICRTDEQLEMARECARDFIESS
jgi:acetate kinase